jgi:hypothetical protein
MLKYCVARNDYIKAGVPTGNVNYVSAQWSSVPAGVTGNLRWDGTTLVGTPSGATVPGTSMTTAQLANPATYTNWDFTAIWKMSGGYPVLKWE